jgi:myo-inositol catabolism protein IolC
VLAFDHRAQLEALADEHGAPRARIRDLKRLIAEGALRGAGDTPGAGVILDDRYGEDVLPALTGRGLWIARPVEAPGSRPLAFEAATTSRWRCAPGRASTSRSARVPYPDDGRCAPHAREAAALRCVQRRS